MIPVAAALLVLAGGTFFWALRGTGYGSPTYLPIGIDFGDGVRRHPVMLYEAAYLCVAVWLDRSVIARDALPGARARVFLAGYCVLAALLGYLKPPFHAVLLLEVIVPQPFAYAKLATAEQFTCICATLFLVSRWRVAASSARTRR